MLYLYDNAIVDDLNSSFNTSDGNEPFVRVVPPEDIISLAAQAKEDKLKFPLIALTREDTVQVDNKLTNFTRMHKGIGTVFDKENNIIYHEKAIPIVLSYNLVCMSPNTADVDEIIRELLFKYTSQYFLTIKVPYESKRKIRFGVRVNPEEEIQTYATTSTYLQEGKLHSAGIHLYIDGAVLLHYTPVKLRRVVHEIVPKVNDYKNQKNSE